ncbi:MAG TPA: carboxypeptidase-like regulatory domain-containing protein [Solirubrobacteraceae bacterium]|nr:carboxypeptidase-like regulatory domain-containing protein [Solirubrobacteraceae bacterium]
MNGQSLIAIALTGPAIVVASATATPPVRPEISAVAAPAELSYGAALAVTGRVVNAGQGVGGASLALQADPYPFRGYSTVARLTTGPDGSFAFAGVKPNRNTRLRVLAEGSPAASSPALPVIVDPVAAINAASLGPGQVRLSLRLRHTPVVRSASVNAWWFVAARGTRVFRLAAVTPTRELSPGLSYASATIDPPSKRFSYRVCLNPTWERAMGAPASHRACPRKDFAVARSAG